VGATNANVMDKAVETLLAFLHKADEAQAARCAAPALLRCLRQASKF
jgi:hypothetical protein